MKIKNVTAKVIGVLGTDMMPDATIEIKKETLMNESVAALVGMGFLVVDNEEETKAALKEELRAELLKELEESGDKPKKRGRKKASEEADADTEE